jgi:sugar phosphate isomerase/epimerase
MVDDRTGKVITEVRKSMVVYEPKFKMTTDENGVERYIDKDGKMLDETNIEDLFRRVPEWDSSRTKFQSKKRTWDYFVKISNRWNEENKRLHPLTGEQIPWTPEEMFFRKQIESRILQSRGSSLYHGRDYDNLIHDREVLLKSLKYYEKVEKDMPEDELYKLEGHPVPGLKSHWGREAQEFVASERKTPTQKIKEALKNVELQMKYTHEASAAADAQSDDLLESLHHVVPVERYAKEKSSWSYAEAGILAWEQTHDNPHAKKDVFVAPENLFPEMGYGTHPEELIELVTKARARMVEMLTAKEIQNPNELRYIDEEHGGQRLLHKINNPYFTGMNEKEAEEIASKHIRATFDTQHLGMWWKHFQPLPGEKYAERKARFDGWYKEMVDKMIDKDIIGHVHAVDAMGGGHHHLPVGQGNIPVKWALERLKEKGFKGSMISEGHEEDSRFGKGRQAAISWRNLGSPYVGKGYSIAAPSQAFSGIHQSYFRNMQSPYFIFGAYSPSNDWQLWSQVPME